MKFMTNLKSRDQDLAPKCYRWDSKEFCDFFSCALNTCDYTRPSALMCLRSLFSINSEHSSHISDAVKVLNDYFQQFCKHTCCMF